MAAEAHASVVTCTVRLSPSRTILYRIDRTYSISRVGATSAKRKWRPSVSRRMEKACSRRSAERVRSVGAGVKAFHVDAPATGEPFAPLASWAAAPSLLFLKLDARGGRDSTHCSRVFLPRGAAIEAERWIRVADRSTERNSCARTWRQSARQATSVRGRETAGARVPRPGSGRRARARSRRASSRRAAARAHRQTPPPSPSARARSARSAGEASAPSGCSARRM